MREVITGRICITHCYDSGDLTFQQELEDQTTGEKEWRPVTPEWKE